MTFLEETIRGTAFIDCRSDIRSYRLREKTRTPETCPGPGGNAAASTGAGTCTRAGSDASAGACEAREEVITCGNDQLEILSRPPSGGLFFGESRGGSNIGTGWHNRIKGYVPPSTQRSLSKAMTKVSFVFLRVLCDLCGGD